MQTDNFDELKNLWQSKKAPSEIDDSELIKSVKEKLKNNQKKLILSNLSLSVSFVVVFIVIGWIWNSFPDRTPFFYISLSFMISLLIFLLIIMWAGVNFRNIDSSIENEEYIKQSIKKIKIRIFAINYVLPVFLFLLLLTFYFYYADVLADESLLTKAIAYTATLVYFIIVYSISNKKRNKSLQENYELIEYLKRWLNSN